MYQELIPGLQKEERTFRSTDLPVPSYAYGCGWTYAHSSDARDVGPHVPLGSKRRFLHYPENHRRPHPTALTNYTRRVVYI